MRKPFITDKMVAYWADYIGIRKPKHAFLTQTLEVVTDDIIEICARCADDADCEGKEKIARCIRDLKSNPPVRYGSW